MTRINVTIEVLEFIILVPIFIVMLKVTNEVAEIVIEHNKVNTRIFSICMSVIAIIIFKQNMMGIVLLPCAIIGTVFFLIPMVSFIDRYKKTKKHKKRWSKYAAKRSWKDRLKTTLRKTLGSIWDLVLMR